MFEYEVDDDGEDRRDDRALRRADEVIRLLFAGAAHGARGRRLARIRAAEADFRGCLEQHAPRLLITPELDLLDLEAQLDPVGASARVASAEVVLLVMPFYLDDQRWWGRDVEDRRLRIRLVQTMVRWAIRLPELSGYAGSCPVWDVEAAVDLARARLRMERAVLAGRSVPPTLHERRLHG